MGTRSGGLVPILVCAQNKRCPTLVAICATEPALSLSNGWGF
jgi:hypothetical protein